MQCGSETQKGTHYKVKGRKVKAAFREVGGGHNTVDRRDSRTLREGRSPALAGAYSDEEGLVTAKGRSPLAQRTRRNVQVLQNKLHRVAKKDLRFNSDIRRGRPGWGHLLWDRGAPKGARGEDRSKLPSIFGMKRLEVEKPLPRSWIG